jgi:hypothetical protein
MTLGSILSRPHAHGASLAAAGPETTSTPAIGGGSSTSDDAYSRARQARLVGLALSGGGIRSTPSQQLVLRTNLTAASGIADSRTG